MIKLAGGSHDPTSNDVVLRGHQELSEDVVDVVMDVAFQLDPVGGRQPEGEGSVKLLPELQRLTLRLVWGIY